MFSNLTTKLALRKVGIKSDTFDFSSPAAPAPAKGSDGAADESGAAGNWPAWMTTKALPWTAQAWLAPSPPPVPVAEQCPKPGDRAPRDRDGQLVFNSGRPVIVLFLRCVGCAFAQKSFLALRAVANRYQGRLSCVVVSHASMPATQKWMDLLGGGWNVEVVVDEDRAIYAAWGLGLHGYVEMFHPAAQAQGWKETGWLGVSVANSLQRTGTGGSGRGGAGGKKVGAGGTGGKTGAAEVEDDGPSTVLGNKWQQAGLFAVDKRGIVVSGAKAARVDDVMDFEAPVKALGL